MRITRLFLILFVVWLAVWAFAQGTYPVQQDTYVNDYANVLTTQEEGALRSMLTSLQNGYHVEMTVLTVNSFRDYKTVDETFENFATSVFNTWKIGDSTRNDGVLILAAMQERKVRIEVGSGYGTAFNDDMKAVIEEFILPDFKQGDYAEGLTDGTREVIREITNPSPSSDATQSWMDYQRTPRPNNSSSSTSSTTLSSNNYRGGNQNTTPLLVAGGATLVVGGGGAMWVLRAMQRRRPRPCPKCGTVMHRLEDYEDDAFLTPGQVSEERVGSIDYDVWECPNCKTHSVFEYPAFLTGYSQCPQCNNKTLGRSSQVIDHATEYSTGLREVRTHCNHCTYTKTWEEVIPMVQRSTSSDNSSSFSSSSSSSDSGGSSSGGGASGSW
jgi:uncharacterized protein